MNEYDNSIWEKVGKFAIIGVFFAAGIFWAMDRNSEKELTSAELKNAAEERYSACIEEMKQGDDYRDLSELFIEGEITREVFDEDRDRMFEIGCGELLNPDVYLNQ